jgi:hypothetical protein
MIVDRPFIDSGLVINLEISPNREEPAAYHRLGDVVSALPHSFSNAHNRSLNIWQC